MTSLLHGGRRYPGHTIECCEVADDEDLGMAWERQILADLDDSRFARLIDGGVTAPGQPRLAVERIVLPGEAP